MLYTAESVSCLHPDKICDQISDLILDLYLAHDEYSRVAVETMGGHNQITITGEVTSTYKPTKLEIISLIVSQFSFLKNYNFQINLSEQSRDIAKGVDIGGAGDQGIMIGYACNSNEEFVPQEYYLARKLCKSIYNLYPNDGKTQVTIDEDGNIETVVASFQNTKAKELKEICKEVYPNAKQYFCNPAGDWTCGSFDADTGLTGRKIAVDNYGPRIPIGGGAFSGKDGTKVDRSGAYIARRIAVDYLKKYDAKEVYVKLAYSIGVAEPVMAVALVDGKEIKIEGYDLTPKGIIDLLELRKPIYFNTAKFGHMGNGFTWG